jgi:alpha-galactosidase
MGGVLGLGGKLTEWSDLELAQVAREVARYKELRATVQLGARHRLSDPTGPGGLPLALPPGDYASALIILDRVGG